MRLPPSLTLILALLLASAFASCALPSSLPPDRGATGDMACDAFSAELRATVQKLCAPGKGILVRFRVPHPRPPLRGSRPGRQPAPARGRAPIACSKC